MKDKTYGPGEHTVEITLRYYPTIAEGETEAEDTLLYECRRHGEMVDWEVK